MKKKAPIKFCKPTKPFVYEALVCFYFDDDVKSIDIQMSSCSKSTIIVDSILLYCKMNSCVGYDIYPINY